MTSTAKSEYPFQLTDTDQFPLNSQVRYDEDSSQNPSMVQMTVSSSSGSGSSQRTYSCQIITSIKSKGRKIAAENGDCKLIDGSVPKLSWRAEKEILCKLEKDMLQYMDSRSLLPLLKAKGMISQDDEEQISSLANGCTNKNRYILDMVPKKGQNALLLFLECLQDEKEHRGHETLARMLQEECYKPVYMEAQKGEVSCEAPRKNSHWESSGQFSSCLLPEVPVRGTPVPEMLDNKDKSDTKPETQNLEMELKVWKEVANKYIEESLAIKMENAKLKYENRELREALLSYNVQRTSSRSSSNT